MRLSHELNRTRNYGWDLSKLIALVLVAYGHFIGTGSYAYEIPGYLSGCWNTPFLPIESHSLWKFDAFLYYKLGTQSAVVGVVVFFIASGYFIPSLQQKTNNNYLGEGKLLLKRMWRLYPEVIPSYIFVSVLISSYSGIKYGIGIHVVNALCISYISGVPSTLGVLWYLNVLIFIYFIASLFRLADLKDIFSVYFALFFLSVLPGLNLDGDGRYIQCLYGIAYLSRMTTIPLIGITMKIVEKSNSMAYRLSWTIVSVLCSLFILNVYYVASKQQFETYGNIMTYVCALLIIYVMHYLGEHFLSEEKQTAAYIMHIKLAIDFCISISIPFYILHAPVGFVTMHYLTERLSFQNSYLKVAFALSLSILGALLISKIIYMIQNIVKNSYEVYIGREVK